MPGFAPTRRILLCVGIGLLLNVGMTAISWLTQPVILTRLSSIERNNGRIYQIDSYNRNLLHTVQWFARNRPVETAGTAHWTDPQAVSTSGFIHQFGFPFHALQHREINSEYYIDRNGHPAFPHSQPTTHTLPLHKRGLPSGLTSRRHQLLPLDPVLPGFLLNTLVYASLPALVLMAAHLRAHRRRQRGHCPACGYPVAGLPTCPECGRAVATPTPVHADDESSNRGVPSAGALRDTN